MALSGSANGGTGPYGTYIRVEWSASQNYGANTSTITTNLYVQLAGGAYYIANESGYTTVDGQQFNFNNGSQTTSPNQKRLLQTTTKTITHNADGTRSFAESASFTCGWSGIGTLTLGSTSFTLDTIPRYATINTFTVTPVTDVGFTINVTTDVTCDLLEYSLDNGSTYTSVSGDFTTKSVTLTDKPSNTSYQVKVRVRRKDSQLKTTSASTVNVTTVNQNNFIGFLL